MKGSWKTSTAGIISIICAIGMALDAYFDGNPQTMPQWAVVGGLVANGIGNLLARDRDVSSEDQGIK